MKEGILNATLLQKGSTNWVTNYIKLYRTKYQQSTVTHSYWFVNTNHVDTIGSFESYQFNSWHYVIQCNCITSLEFLSSDIFIVLRVSMNKYGVLTKQLSYQN